MSKIELPEDVIDWFRVVFAACNDRISMKIAVVPNAPEPSLDMTFIEHFTGFGAPRAFESGWTVRIDTHFLGGLRHFYGKWEIADIGLLVHYRKNGKLLQSKAAVLQSKRLYPEGITVREDLLEDYETGFARLADPEDVRVPLYMSTDFTFDSDCRYGALHAHDPQYQAIEKYERQSKVPIFYQFYNPPTLPFSQRVPLPGNYENTDENKFGTRIAEAKDIHCILKPHPEQYSPTVADIAGSDDATGWGWRLEYFVADLLLQCKKGYIFADVRDENIFNLFNRRSGPIAAAVAFSIETPER